MPTEYVPADIRRLVEARAQGCCEYCRIPARFVPDSFTIDHIWPVVAGGETHADNLAWACAGCNGRKHVTTEAIDPQTDQPVRLFNPRQQIWSEHFVWGNDKTLVIGLTPTGRATVGALNLNRLTLVNLRHLLTQAGLHPPPA